MKYGMHTTPKLILACVLVPVAAGAMSIPLLRIFAIFVVFFAFVFLVFIGTPVFLMLRSRHRLSGSSLALAGLLSGLIPTAIWILVTLPNVGAAPGGITLTICFGLAGIPCALLYGAVWNLLSAKEDRFPWRPAKASKA